MERSVDGYCLDKPIQLIAELLILGAEVDDGLDVEALAQEHQRPVHVLRAHLGPREGGAPEDQSRQECVDGLGEVAEVEEQVSAHHFSGSLGVALRLALILPLFTSYSSAPPSPAPSCSRSFSKQASFVAALRPAVATAFATAVACSLTAGGQSLGKGGRSYDQPGIGWIELERAIGHQSVEVPFKVEVFLVVAPIQLQLSVFIDEGGAAPIPLIATLLAFGLHCLRVVGGGGEKRRDRGR